MPSSFGPRTQAISETQQANEKHYWNNSSVLLTRSEAQTTVYTISDRDYISTVTVNEFISSITLCCISKNYDLYTKPSHSSSYFFTSTVVFHNRSGLLTDLWTRNEQCFGRIYPILSYPAVQSPAPKWKSGFHIRMLVLLAGLYG